MNDPDETGPTVLHITTAAAWASARDAGEIAPPSLAEQGFVHLSTAAQVDGVLTRFYAGVADLLLVRVDPGLLEAAGVELRWEAPAHPDGSPVDEREAAERYPHAYGPIPLTAVVEVSSLPR